MRQPVPDHVLSAGLVFALSACALLMTGLASRLFAAERAPAFPRLSDNVAASERLEVRRQIKGNIQSMFALPARNEVIVAAEGYLWRFTADGHLIDTLDTPGAMHRNGISFADDAYVDWVHTGQRTPKTYASQIDGNALDEVQLHSALSGAKVVAFDRRENSAWALLWDGDKAWKMDISRHRARIDVACTPRGPTERALSWSDTCLQGWAASRESPMVEIKPELFPDEDEGLPFRVEVVGFDRRRYHLEGGAAGYAVETVVGGAIKAIAPHLPGGLPSRYWFGDAHTRLHLGGEVLQFKAFVGRRNGDYEFWHMMDWWDPSTVIPGASPWLRVRMRGYMDHPGEEALWELYRRDLGLYAVRPRQSPRALPPAERRVSAWTPAFEGPPTPRDAVTAAVVLEGGATVHRWLRAKPPGLRISAPVVELDADSPPLDALPTALHVVWGSPWNKDRHTVVEVTLAAEQTRAAFALLPRSDVPATVVLQAPDLFGEADTMRVLLRRGGTEIPLDHAVIEHVLQPPFRPWRGGEGPPPPTRMAQLEQTGDAVLGGQAGAMERFQAQTEALVRDADMVEHAVPFVVAGYARLLNGLNGSGRADVSMALVRHYLDRVHPLAAVHLSDASAVYNVSVIASQTLAVGVHRPQDTALVDTAVTTLLGAAFDPDAHSNATLLYNLACYYALRGDRPRMLRHVAAAFRLGKSAGQFEADRDFARYLDDPGFKTAIGR